MAAKSKVTLRTRRARLKKLIDYLQHIPKGRQFNMKYYGRHIGEHTPEEENYCGTAACALGHAAMIPSFRRAGLHMRWARLRPSDPTCTCDACVRSRKQPAFDATILFGRKRHNEAGQAFFGLSSEEAWLFGETHLSRSAVISRLRTMLKAQP